MIEEIKEAVIAGDAELTVELVRRAVDGGADPQEITDDALTAGLRVVGERFDRGEYFIPEMLIAADAMKQAMEILEPLLAPGDVRTSGTVVMGTVQGDLHDIGKNIVISMLQGAGFQVVDLGVDVPTGRYIEAVGAHEADLVGLGALLTTALDSMHRSIEALQALDPAPRIMVGGAAVTPDLGDRFGVDGYAPNAKQAVDLAVRLMEG